MKVAEGERPHGKTIMSRADIKRAIAWHMTAAADEAAAVRALREADALTKDALRQHLRAYILYKYRLAPGEALDGDGAAEERLEKLAQISLDKMLKEAPEQAVAETMSATCDGADSVSMKLALLLMAIQEDFEVRFDGYEVAFAETVDELVELAWKSIERG